MKMESMVQVQAFILERIIENNSDYDTCQTYKFYLNYISQELPSLMRFKHYMAEDVKFFEKLAKTQGGPIHTANFNIVKDIFINCFT